MRVIQAVAVILTALALVPGGAHQFVGDLFIRQCVQALPTIVEGDPRFGLEPAARVGLRTAAAPSLAFNGDRKLGKRCRTRRFGGRRDRRVLEGMRGCSAHEANIARQKNKSRTSSTTIQTEAQTLER
jgi:hypothetical protein